MTSTYNYAMIIPEKYVKEKLILSKRKRHFVNVSSLSVYVLIKCDSFLLMKVILQVSCYSLN